MPAPRPAFCFIDIEGGDQGFKTVFGFRFSVKKTRISKLRLKFVKFGTL